MRRLDQADQQVLRAADLAVDLHGQSRRNDRAFLGAAAGQQAKHRRDELVEGEDRRRREARQDDNRAAAGGREADRLAWLERDAVRDDAGVVELGDDAVRHVAGALARAARQQHEVGELERLAQPLAQRRHVVRDDARAAPARRRASRTASASTCALES